jgi:hypothetical protein
LRILDAAPAIVRDWQQPDGQTTAMPDFVLDLVFVALMVAFFALSTGLIRFCATLMEHGSRR